jgi:aminoglycoside phosphotransferase (APT) family kinase protein
VLCHNDVNPTNIVYDGRRVLLVDWQNAARNDPLYDLATAAMFFRMDEPACRALLAAYDGTPDAELSPRFHYDRRLAAASSGAAFLRLAHSAGHTGATADATLDSAPSLAELYRGLTTGSISLATPDGQWRFGLALVRTSVELALRGPER